MSQCVIDSLPFLKQLKESTKPQFRALIKDISPEHLRAICESADNVCHGQVYLEDEHKQDLRPYKEDLLTLSDPEVTDKNKKKILTHQLLTVLLTPLLDGQ